MSWSTQNYRLMDPSTARQGTMVAYYRSPGARVFGVVVGVLDGVDPTYVTLDPDASGVRVDFVGRPDVLGVVECPPELATTLARVVMADLARVASRRRADNDTLTPTERHMVGWIVALAAVCFPS